MSKILTKIDLTDLVKQRWIHGLNIKQLMDHFGYGQSTIKQKLRKTIRIPHLDKLNLTKKEELQIKRAMRN